MRRPKINPHINKYRVETGAKGYITRGELSIYAGVGARNARMIYQAVEKRILANGRIPLTYGLSVNEVNDFLGLDQKEIERLAAAGL